MGGKEIDFKDKKIEFYRNKKTFKIKDIDINEILISNRKLNHMIAKIIQKKYTIGYSDDVIKPLHILLPQMIGYFSCFKDNKE